MAISIQPKTVYGLRSDVKGNIHFTAKHEVIYPVSGVIAVHDYSTNKQKFLRLAENNVATIIAISPNRKSLAISERNELSKKYIINVYDVATLKKRRTLVLPQEVPVQEPSSVVFTQDSKGLAVLSKEPDAFLTIFYFDKLDTIILGRVSNASQKGLSAEHISCNLNDSGLVAVCGHFTFKLLSRQDRSFGTIGTINGEHKILTSLTWLTAEVLVAGTSANQLLFVEGGDPKVTYEANKVNIIDLERAKESEDEQLQRLSHLKSTVEKHDVNCLTYFEKGFCFAQNNYLYVFEKEQSYVRFTRKTILRIPIKLYKPDAYCITNVSVNLEMDTVIVSAKHSQIYIGKLFKPETVKLQDIEFQLLGESLHIDGIIEMSVCSWKSIIMTASKDQTIRIWNYDTGNIEMIRKYETDIEVIAVHPTGMFAAVGFSDQLCLMEILLNDLKIAKTFNFPSCKNLGFSHQGHMLACAYERLISIVSVFSFSIVRTLKGHSGNILSLAWSHDDNFIISSDNAGAIYEWDITTGQRGRECIQKGIKYRSLAFTRSTSIYACTNTGVFREIQNSDVVREITPFCSVPLTCIALARSDLMLFMSSEKGHLYNIQIPFLDSGGGTCTNYRLFNTEITCMRITYDDRYLVTGLKDGTLAIWIILNNKGKTADVDPKHGTCVDIIIPRKELIEKNETINCLESRVLHQTNEYQYQLDFIKKQNASEIKQIHDHYSVTIDNLKMDRNELERNYEKEINIIRAAIDEIKDENSRATLETESKFNEKIIIEFEKTAAIKTKMDEMKEQYEKLLRKSTGSLQDTIETMEMRLKQQLDEHQQEKRQLLDEIKENKLEFTEYCRQLNVNNERHLVKIKIQYEQQLEEENKAVEKWRAEAGVLNKKINLIKTKCLDLEMKNNVLETEHTKNKQLVSQYEQNITELERELCIKDETLRNKEEWTMITCKTNQELEAQIVRLNKKISDLKMKIEPLEASILQKNNHNINLQFQLDTLKKNELKLDFRIDTLKNKCHGIKVELQAQKEKFAVLQTYLKRMSTDIFIATQNIQEPHKLKEHVLELYQKYLKRTNTKMQEERIFVRRLSIEKRSAIPCKFKYLKEKKKLLHDNLKLVTEIEKLREEYGKLKNVKHN